MDEPKPYYPPDWQDDQSMDVLFSPFRENRDINPQSWDSKMKFWKEMVFHECRYSKSSIINPKMISHTFLRKGKRPVCLDKVLAELNRLGKIQRLCDFEASINKGWLSWGLDVFVKKPLSWTFNKVFSYSDTLESNEEFIVPEMLQEQAEAVLEHHYRSVCNDTTDHLVEYTELAQQMENICSNPRDLDFVLMLLCKEKKITIASTGQGQKERIVRFAKRDKRSVTPVSELDLRIIRLQKAESHLQNQVEQISEEMERCRDDAKIYLQKGLRNSAKNALKRKKTLERILTKRETAQENIRVLIQRIRDAESDKVVLDAYADGTNAFKEMTAASGLNVDRIDDVMTDLQDVFDMQQEINASISQGPTDPLLDISAADLESELNDILESDTASDMETDLSRMLGAQSLSDKDLPSVPTFDPSVPSHQNTSPSRPKPQSYFKMGQFS